MPDNASANIMVVDDDPEIRAILRECFTMEGYGVSEAANGTEMHAALQDTPIDLITLDLNLPGEDGLTLAREIRTKSDIPIIMVTGKGDMVDRVVGLEVGADDYIAKPFHLREVLARVRSVLRRSSATKISATLTEPATAASVMEQSDAPPHERYYFEDWSLDATARELFDAEGQPSPLTTAEFNLLLLFVKRPHTALSRDAIMDGLKGHDWSPMDRSIDTLVGRLRKKIDAGGGPSQLVKTVRGIGYMFAADVTRQ